MKLKKPSRRNPVAVVTGAGQGIGAAIAEALAESGWIIAALDIETTKTKALVRRLKRRNLAAFSFECDVSKPDAVNSVLNEIETSIGGVGVLINNAGVGGPFHRVDQVSDAEWESIFATNVKSILNLCRFLLPKMKKRSFGRVVNIASIQGLLGASRSSTYVASKHAVVGYTRAIAAEWGPHGITCNAVCPGYVRTKMGVQSKSVSNHQRRVMLRTPTRKIASPREIAFLVKNLVNPEAGYMNGSVVVADGGITADIGVS